MQKPTKARWDKDRNLTKLFFDENLPPEYYYVRGSIEWPIGLMPGYALLSAQNIRTKELWIYEEFPFWSVSTTGTNLPLWAWLKDVWKKYLCRYFYYTNTKDHPRYYLQILREPLIRTHPVFVEAELASKNQASIDNLLLEYQRLKRIKIDKEAGNPKIMGNLLDQLMAKKKGYIKEDIEIPGVTALWGLLAGYEKFPYKQPMMEDEVPMAYV